jgi:hypothetical protein
MLLRQLMLVLVGLMVINAGTLSLLQGELHYQNYRRAWVFAPFSLLLGALAIVLAIRLRKRKMD